VDIFAQKVMSAIFNCHVPLYLGSDEFISVRAKLQEGRLSEGNFAVELRTDEGR
jgi:hypothetical protein